MLKHMAAHFPFFASFHRLCNPSDITGLRSENSWCRHGEATTTSRFKIFFWFYFPCVWLYATCWWLLEQNLPIWAATLVWPVLDVTDLVLWWWVRAVRAAILAILFSELPEPPDQPPAYSTPTTGATQHQPRQGGRNMIWNKKKV